MRLKRRVRVPIWLVLALAFSSLVLVTTAIIASRLYTAAFRSTGELVAEMGDARLTSLEEALKAELRPAQDSSNFIGQYILSGRVAVTDDRRIEDLLLGSLAASPQVIGVALIRPDLYAVAAARTSGGQPFATSAGSVLTDPLFRLAFRTGSSMPGTDWGDPIYAPGLQVSGLPLLAPLRRDGQIIAVVATLISVPELTTHVLQRVGDGSFGAFVLLDDNSVLVHAALAAGRFAPTVDKPLPKADELSDPILSAFRPMAGDDRALHPHVKLKFSLQQAVINDVRRLYLFRKIDVVGSRPWTAALVFNANDLEGEFQSLRVALWVSIAVAGFAAVCAILLGRSISRPIHDFAAAARRLAALEFDNTPAMRGSWLQEFDMAAEAYNGMRSGLTWLSTYVPRSLVPVLMQPGSEKSFVPKEREVTVLFTDIVGFTAIGQRLSAPALARFINRHFAMLGMAIEAEGGTIDKYIGDSVMAFWSAPTAQADHAERAVRAALAIARRMRADNERRRHKGFNPVRMRIGIHSGFALAGNIGAPGRINYTLVGDTVNIAQRLEQFGKEIDDGMTDVIITVSQSVADRLPVEIETIPLGTHQVIERGEPIGVYRIVAWPDAPAIEATPQPD
jgi:class 3 adenylate cyclase